MTSYSIGIFPDEDDLGPFGVCGNLRSEIPTITVTKSVTVQFRPENHEFAIRYLNKLADEAQKLAQQIAEARS